MKSIKIFKTALDVLFALAILAFAAFVVYISYLIYDGKVEYEGIYFQYTSFLIKYFLFISILYLFRQLVGDYLRNSYFSKNICHNFKRIGYLFLGLGLLKSTADLFFLMNIVDYGSIWPAFLSAGYSLFFWGTLGFFFMVLSKIFSLGFRLKTESDLTV